MPGLKLFLLGSPRIEQDGQPYEVKRRKLWAILAYLAVSGETQRRDTLATLLWPDSDQSQARAAPASGGSMTRIVADARLIRAAIVAKSDGIPSPVSAETAIVP